MHFLPDRKPGILPLTDLDCTSEWHQKQRGETEQQPCPVLHHASGLGCEEFQRKTYSSGDEAVNERFDSGQTGQACWREDLTE